MASLFAELKRRNVFKVAAGYAVASWIFIEAGSVLLPEFGLEDWFRTWVYIVAGGFIVACIAAWVLEITPDGVKLESNLDRSDYQPDKSDAWKFILVGMLVIALVVSLSINFTSLSERRASFSRQPSYSSIAVLPFENRSTDPDNRFFADGIHDDILGRLSAIDTLNVISRTSVSEYRDTDKNARQIGEELGVETIVEGSVQRAGDQVRVVVALVDTASSQQLWTSTYDRNASIQSVFELQSEIATEIADSLRTALTPEDQLRIASIPTLNVDAYAAFVSGTHNLLLRNYQSLNTARAAFEEAIALDPEYAEAHAALAETIMVLMNNHGAITPLDAHRLARASVERALQLDPGLARAYAVRGFIASSEWQRDRLGGKNVAAEEDFTRALSLNPNLSEAYVWFGTLRENENRIGEAIELMSQALIKDPLNRIPFVNLPGLWSLQGQNDRSLQLLLRAINTYEDWPLPVGYLAQTLQKLGRLDEAVAWTVKLRRMSSDPLAGTNMFGLLRVFDHDQYLLQLFDEFPRDHPVFPIAEAYKLYFEGNYERALQIAEAVETEELASVGALYPLMSRSAIMLQRYDDAARYLGLQSPVLVSDVEAPVSRFNVNAALLMAFVEQKRGNERNSAELLQQVLQVAESLPRVGYSGHGILDVRALTLQGRTVAALEALTEAVDAGVTSTLPFGFW
ncbi:MAG: hypothetical protein R3358_02915 [Woeseiaceae bacterium]|nr:hypothetical protein [Woeseiaceae bacterium]